MALLKGRLFRKATEPMKPLNPAKKKLMTTVAFNTSEKQHEEKPGPSSLDQGESKDYKKYVVRCVKKTESEHETIVTEDQEEIIRNAVKNTRQRQESVRINIGELVPEGEIKTSGITLNLVKGSKEVKLSLKYCPTDY